METSFTKDLIYVHVSVLMHICEDGIVLAYQVIYSSLRHAVNLVIQCGISAAKQNGAFLTFNCIDLSVLKTFKMNLIISYSCCQIKPFPPSTHLFELTLKIHNGLGCLNVESQNPGLTMRMIFLYSIICIHTQIQVFISR